MARYLAGYTDTQHALAIFTDPDDDSQVTLKIFISGGLGGKWTQISDYVGWNGTLSNALIAGFADHLLPDRLSDFNKDWVLAALNTWSGIPRS